MVYKLFPNKAMIKKKQPGKSEVGYRGGGWEVGKASWSIGDKWLHNGPKG